MKRIQSKNFPPLDKLVHHDGSVNFRIGSKQIMLDQENKEGVNFFSQLMTLIFSDVIIDVWSQALS